MQHFADAECNKSLHLYVIILLISRYLWTDKLKYIDSIERWDFHILHLKKVKNVLSFKQQTTATAINHISYADPRF